MDEKFHRHDFNYGNHKKKKYSKIILIVALICIIFFVIKMIPDGEKGTDSSVSTKSIKLEIPKIHSTQEVAKTMDEKKGISLKQVQVEAK